MYTDKGMDSGDIKKMEKIKIKDDDTYDIISERMSVLGAKLLKEVLPGIFEGTNERIKQDDDKKILAPVIKREDEHIDFNKKVEEVHNQIRGLSSVPGAYTILDDNIVKVLLSEKENIEETNEEPGTITRVDKNGIYVACKDKEIKITKLQVSGKKPMLVRDYLNGIKKDSLISKKLV